MTILLIAVICWLCMIAYMAIRYEIVSSASGRSVLNRKIEWLTHRQSEQRTMRAYHQSLQVDIAVVDEHHEGIYFRSSTTFAVEPIILR